MKTTAIIILILGFASSATAQYARSSKNDTGIFTTETKNGDKITIALNSDKTNFTVEYSLSEPFNKAVLVVKEPIGKIIVMEELIDTRDQIIIVTDNWPAGQYTVSLFADKKEIMTKKITLSK